MNKFYMPETIDQLVGFLSNRDEKTFIIAGGTDLAVKINERKLLDFNLIDISNLKEIQNIEETDREIVIGAGVTMTTLENNDILKSKLNALVIAAKNLGSAQIRNRATIGGNVANASQSADTLTVMFAYNALCEIINSKGEICRKNLEDVIVGLEKNNLSKDEVIIRFIINKENRISGFAKVGARKAVTISKVNICLNTIIKDGVIENPIVYIGAVGERPIKATIIEKALEGRKFEKRVAIEIREYVEQEIENAIPNRASKHYKKLAAIGVLHDAVGSAFSGCMGEEFPKGMTRVASQTTNPREGRLS